METNMNYFTIPGMKTFERKKEKRTKTIAIAYAYYNQQEVINKICQYFDYSYETLQSPTRKGEIVFARQICQWFLMRKCGLTCTHVAGLFLRDHSSILHSLTVVENMLKADYDNKYKYHINQLKNIL